MNTLDPAAGPLPVRVLKFVRFSHTIFALPFALGSLWVASDGRPGWRLLGLILLAMIAARTAAMGFNRVADWEIDQRNPRTAGRHRLMSRRGAVWLTGLSAAFFVGVTFWINPVCFVLSPVALALIFFYSLTKRFTRFAQFFLGLALAVAPVGAWLAVTGTLAWPPLWLALAVLVWVAGFDMIYATQDVEIDRREGLHSMVTWLGVPRALSVARGLHLAAFVGLGLFGWSAGLGGWYGGGLGLIALVLIYEHREAGKTSDLAAINRAFFLSNALVGVLFLLATGLAVR